jgi:ATP-binding cassette subfamily B (MDR/TAP) protein 1
MYASERQLARLRFAFLEAVLSQDVGAFDTDLSGGKIITGVTNHMSIIQDAIGEKVRAYIFDQFLFNLLSEKQNYGANIYNLS